LLIFLYGGDKITSLNMERIEYNNRSISNNLERIGSLEGKIDDLETVVGGGTVYKFNLFGG